ncbi:16875_t:CDS:2, partial [Cetraspora pellucida]
GRPKHRLSKHFLVLDEKANSINKATVCKYCINYFGFQQACLTSKITNVVNSCLAYFQKYKIFANKYLPEEIDQILVSTADATKKITQAQISMTQQDLHSVTIAFDSWKNIIKQKLLGIIFIISKADHYEKLFQKAADQNIKILAFVTDSASENATARQRLQLQRQNLLYLLCFAHQANLCIADIFKSNPDYIKASTNSWSIFSFFNSSIFWLEHFRYEQVLAYNEKCSALIRLVLAICQLREELHCMHQLTKLKKLEERCNNTNTNKQAKTSYELDNIYLKETNKDN